MTVTSCPTTSLIEASMVISPVIKTLATVPVVATVIVIPAMVIKPAIIVIMVVIYICTIVRAIPVTIKGYSIVSCTIISCVHERTWCADFVSAGTTVAG